MPFESWQLVCSVMSALLLLISEAQGMSGPGKEVGDVMEKTGNSTQQLPATPTNGAATEEIIR